MKKWKEGQVLVDPVTHKLYVASDIEFDRLMKLPKKELKKEGYKYNPNPLSEIKRRVVPSVCFEWCGG